MRRWLLLVVLGLIPVEVVSSPKVDISEEKTPDNSVRSAWEKSLNYLLNNQNENGQWDRGHGFPKSIPNAQLLNAKEEKQAHQLSTTCLAYMALNRSPESFAERAGQAMDKAEPFIIKAFTDLGPRDSSMVMDKRTYSRAYGMLALSEIIERHKEGPLFEMAQKALSLQVKHALDCQHNDGGWHYADEKRIIALYTGRKVKAPYEQMTSCSFLTSLMIEGLLAARRVGLELEGQAIEKLKTYMISMKAKDGGFHYFKKPKNKGRGGIQVKYRGFKSSLGRMALCHMALNDLGVKNFKDYEKTSELFISNHKALDRVYGKGGSHHEKIFNNAGYYWQFGYMHTAEVARRLGDKGSKLRELVNRELVKRQQANGTWQDHPMLGKAYSAACGSLTLGDQPLFR